MSSKKRIREKCEDYRWEVLKNSACVDCGETNPILLDFDHIDPAQKSEKISRLVSKGSYNALVEEVKKCEIRCTSCHRLKSAMDHAYYKRHINWNDPAIVDKYMQSFLIYE